MVFRQLVIPVITVILLISCGPKCLRGHDENVWKEKQCWTEQIESIPMGTRSNPYSFPIYGQQCHEAHWEKVFLCDEYEIEKNQ